jgi:hypothetical protein
MHFCKGTEKTIMQNESSNQTQYALKWKRKDKKTHIAILSMGQKTQTFNLI